MNTDTATPAQAIALDLAAYRAQVDPTAEFSAWIRLPFQERVARAQDALSRQTPIQLNSTHNPKGS